MPKKNISLQDFADTMQTEIAALGQMIAHQTTIMNFMVAAIAVNGRPGSTLLQDHLQAAIDNPATPDQVLLLYRAALACTGAEPTSPPLSAPSHLRLLKDDPQS